jgi:hypothetical protein
MNILSKIEYEVGIMRYRGYHEYTLQKIQYEVGTVNALSKIQYEVGAMNTLSRVVQSGMKCLGIYRPESQEMYRNQRG